MVKIPSLQFLNLSDNPNLCWAQQDMQVLHGLTRLRVLRLAEGLPISMSPSMASCMFVLAREFPMLDVRFEAEQSDLDMDWNLWKHK